jgi:hypothetical protein
LLDEGFEEFDLPRSEGFVEDRAKRSMIGVVARTEGPGWKPPVLFVERGHARLAVRGRRCRARCPAQIGFRIEEDLADLLEAGDDEEAGLRILPDRCFVAQDFIGGIWTFLEIAIEKIDLIGMAGTFRGSHGDLHRRIERSSPPNTSVSEKIYKALACDTLTLHSGLEGDVPWDARFSSLPLIKCATTPWAAMVAEWPARPSSMVLRRTDIDTSA